MVKNLALALVALAACGSPAPERTAAPDPTPSERAELYEATATVLENKDHGPELCLGGIADSLPPQCGGVPLENWDWGTVADEESRAGTTWGVYHVVGTYDGGSFIVTETGTPEPTQSMGNDDPIETPCEEPEDGWISPDIDRATEDYMFRAIGAARHEPDFSGVWIDYVDESYLDADIEAGNVILNVAFTGDLDRHERELREIWGGPLCLVVHVRNMKELNAVRSEVEDSLASYGLQMLWSDADEVTGTIEIGVVAIDEATQGKFDERYGPGLVLFESALKPVE